MKEGIKMASRNGMGPMNQGPLTGRGMGNCVGGGLSARKIGMGIGAGVGMGIGLARGFGGGRGRGLGIGQRGARFQQMASPVYNNNQTDSKEALEAYKEELQRELADVDSKITQVGE